MDIIIALMIGLGFMGIVVIPYVGFMLVISPITFYLYKKRGGRKGYWQWLRASSKHW